MINPALGREPRTIVAIPAKNEAERIAACLLALDRQTHRPDAVLLLVNNATDGTAAVARDLAVSYRLDVISRDLPPDLASAGHARRMVMNIAAANARPGTVLLTTDADAVMPPDWIARNRAAIARGADVVCGRITVDPSEAALIPAHLHDDDAREQRLTGLLDPEPHDPPPRHTEAAGASIAVTAAAFARAGGIPPVSSGEDRAFVRNLWLLDARVRHDPSIEVAVSGRILGRAAGGMADTIRRRIVQQDEFTDDQLEPAADAHRRYGLRARARRAWAGGLASPALCRDLGLGAIAVVDALVKPHFGAAWAALEATSPVLRRRRVRFTELRREIAVAEALLQRLSVPETMAAD